MQYNQPAILKISAADQKGLVAVELDNEFVIAQDVVRVCHTDSVNVLVRKGRDLD